MPDFDLTILGGGAIGLSAAYLAARAGHRVLVLESSARVGGLLSTFSVGGSRLEQYYHHFFSHDVELRWLVDELGIGQQLQFYPTSMGVFRNGAHHPFNGPRDLLTFSPISFLDRIRFAASSVYLARFVDWRSSENTSALDWFYRYSGKRATEAIWRPMLEIKFGPHARDVPVAWMAGRLRQRLNSRERGVERLGYIQGSLQVLLDTLLTKLSALGVTIRTNSPATALDVRDGRVVAVKVGAESICTGSVLATIPASPSCAILALCARSSSWTALSARPTGSMWPIQASLSVVLSSTPTSSLHPITEAGTLFIYPAISRQATSLVLCLKTRCSDV